MNRSLFAVLAVVVAIAAAPAAGDVYTRKQSVDARLSALHAKIARTKERSRSLSAEIASASTQIHALQARVGDVSARLATLEADLALHRGKLERLTELFRVETERFLFLRKEYGIALARLNARLVDVYERGDLDTVDVILAASSLSDVLDGLDYIKQAGAQDRLITGSVGRAKVATRNARERTRKLRAVVAAETRAVAVRTQQARALRDQLLANTRELVSARSQKRVGLSQVKASEREAVGEAEALERVSAALGAQIRAAQAAAAARAAAAAQQSSSSYQPSSSTQSASGFIWPVSGPVVSPFGVRWGRMHTGIDIAVGYGTPIHAAAAGTVIYAGWMDGYGNLVFIDHGGGISTGYAHQSSIAVSNGQTVSQGQVIGYVGCTGHCFGPHLHFEVRLNGNPVDPLGYL
jgi:murein DD-endopeptidase MepM/ murein hydrolase activator NlpD